VQVDFHVFGDEVGRVQRGLHRVLQISQRAGQVCDSQRVRGRTQGFLSAKHVHRSFWEELIDVQEIGSAEHVKRNGDWLHRFWEIRLLPRVQFLQLSNIKLRELLFKKRRVLLPCGVARERRERRVFRNGHSCKKTRDIVRPGSDRQSARRDCGILLRKGTERKSETYHKRCCQSPTIFNAHPSWSARTCPRFGKRSRSRGIAALQKIPLPLSIDIDQNCFHDARTGRLLAQK